MPFWTQEKKGQGKQVIHRWMRKMWQTNSCQVTQKQWDTEGSLANRLAWILPVCYTKFVFAKMNMKPAKTIFLKQVLLSEGRSGGGSNVLSESLVS